MILIVKKYLKIYKKYDHATQRVVVVHNTIY
jgi:hypothetical protein